MFGAGGAFFTPAGLLLFLFMLRNWMQAALHSSAHTVAKCARCPVSRSRQVPVAMGFEKSGLFGPNIASWEMQTLCLT